MTNFYSFSTKVYEESIINPCRREVVDKLYFMGGTQVLYGFQFQDESVIYDDVSLILSNDDSIVIYLYRFLRLKRQIQLTQFYNHSILVDSFQISLWQLPSDSYRTVVDAIYQCTYIIHRLNILLFSRTLV